MVLGPDLGLGLGLQVLDLDFDLDYPELFGFSGLGAFGASIFNTNLFLP